MNDPDRHPAIRAADAEREQTVALLRRAVVDGRLTLEEFSDRVGLAPFASQKIQSSSAPPVPGAPLLRITIRGPGGTLYVRNQRQRPNRWTRLLGAGDPAAQVAVSAAPRPLHPPAAGRC